MADETHYYRVNGLLVAATRALMGAAESPPPAAAPDVTVAFEPVPHVDQEGDRPVSEFLVAADGDVRFWHRNGRVRISGGRRISIDLAPNASEAWIATVVFGVAMAVILHQRGSPPLHCCCVADDSGALLLFGESGAGKSTTALKFRERGWRILAEDMVALDFSGERICALPSAGLARFWSESSDGVEPEAFGRKLQLGSFPKLVIALGGDQPAEPTPVRALCFLEWLHPSDAPAEIEGMPPLQALLRLRASVYRDGLIGALGLHGAYMKKLGRLAAQAPAFALRRPRSFERMEWLDRLTSWSDVA